MIKACCWKCGANITDEIIDGKIPFRGTCPKCGFDLHTCKGCRYYSPGKPNDCLVPGTEFVADREKNNLCDEFSPGSNVVKSKEMKEVADKLFGKNTSDKDIKKKNFDQLFDG